MKENTVQKMDDFVSAIDRAYFRLHDEALDKALNLIENLPLTDEHIETITKTGRDVFVNAAQSKREQRLNDFEDALGDAVDKGVYNLNEFVLWLGLDEDASNEDILRQAHVYRRIGEVGKPETAQLS